jgi:hypothetical protein
VNNYRTGRAEHEGVVLGYDADAASVGGRSAGNCDYEDEYTGGTQQQ